MIVLLIVNLAWLTFDWFYVTAWFPDLVGSVAPRFGTYYAEVIHPRYWQFDLVFVSIFLTEFFLRWGAAARRGTYLRWYFYPFLHWYELLGCIPLLGFRLLRFLRIFSMLYRLQKMGVVDLSESAPARFLQRYYDVLVEEISDRVVVNMIEGVQRELREDQPIVRRIIEEVVVSRKALLVDQLGARLEQVVKSHYDTRRERVAGYLRSVIADAVSESEDIERLQRIPVFGGYGTRVLERSLVQVVTAAIDRAAADLESHRNRDLVEEVVAIALEQLLAHGPEVDEVISEVLVEALDVVKSRVEVKRWRENLGTVS
jgi:hypothetical protein